MEFKGRLGKLFSRNRDEPRRISTAESQKDAEWWLQNKLASDYDWNAKMKNIAPLLKVFDEEGMIGNTVLDIGSGPRPLSSVLKKEGRKLLAADFVRPLVAHDFHHVRGDVRQVNHPDSFAMRRALVQAAQILGVDPRTSKPQQVDTMIFSDILNYVPYQETIRSFDRYLKRGGLLVVLNKPERTFEGAKDILDPEGVKSTREMLQFLERAGFRMLLSVPLAQVAQKGRNRIIPVRQIKEGDLDSFMVFAVFRKENFMDKAYGILKGERLQRLPEKDQD